MAKSRPHGGFVLRNLERGWVSCLEICFTGGGGGGEGGSCDWAQTERETVRGVARGETKVSGVIPRLFV